MPAPHIHTFYQYAYLKHPPRRYALLRSEEALRRDQKYDEHYRTITAALLARHLAGGATSPRQSLETAAHTCHPWTLTPVASWRSTPLSVKRPSALERQRADREPSQAQQLV